MYKEKKRKKNAQSHSVTKSHCQGFLRYIIFFVCNFILLVM